MQSEHKVQETIAYDPEEFLNLHNRDLSLRELANHLNESCKLYDEDATIHWHQESYYSVIEVSWYRPETDTERELREKTEKKLAEEQKRKHAKKLEEMRAKLAELEAKYEE